MNNIDTTQNPTDQLELTQQPTLTELPPTQSPTSAPETADNRGETNASPVASQLSNQHDEPGKGLLFGPSDLRLPEISRFSNSQIEYALLASCIMDENCMLAATDSMLTPGDFSNRFNAELWRALVAMFNTKQPIDEVTVAEFLINRSHFQDKDTVVTIGSICQTIDFATPCRTASYAHAVIQHSKLRKLRNTLDQITQSLNNHDLTPDQLIQNAEARITQLAVNNVETEHTSPVCDLVPDIMQRLLNPKANDKLGIMTGLDKLDSCLHGLKPGQLCILAARPAMGKTALALNLATMIAQHGTPTLFVSLEMNTDELMHRLLASISGVNLQSYRDRYCSNEATGKLHKASEELAKLPIFVDDYCMQTTNNIASNLRRMQHKYGIQMLVVDYLQLITPRTQSIPREQQIAEISRALKFTAKSLNIPLLCLAQLNRSAEIENRQPRLSDLRESGTIEQDADIVMFLDQSEHSRSDPRDRSINFVERDLIVAKNRSGPTTLVPLVFNKGATSFKPRAILETPPAQPF